MSFCEVKMSVEMCRKDLFDVAPHDIEPLPRQPNAPKRPRPLAFGLWSLALDRRYAVPDSEGVRVASSTDPELSFAQSMLDCKRPRSRLRDKREK